MALIVETGAGVANADAYHDLAYADAYHAARGNASWALAPVPTREAAIRNATQFMDMSYLPRWKGAKVAVLQARQWPRWGVVLDAVRGTASERYDVGFTTGRLPNDLIPEQLKHASCELALRALSGSLAEDLQRGGRIKRKKTDVLETEYEASAPAFTVYRLVDLLLGELLVARGVIRLERA